MQDAVASLDGLDGSELDGESVLTTEYQLVGLEQGAPAETTGADAQLTLRFGAHAVELLLDRRQQLGLRLALGQKVERALELMVIADRALADVGVAEGLT